MLVQEELRGRGLFLHPLILGELVGLDSFGRDVQLVRATRASFSTAVWANPIRVVLLEIRGGALTVGAQTIFGEIDVSHL